MASISNRNGSFVDLMNEDKCYAYGGYIIDEEQLIIELYRFVFISKKHYKNGLKKINITGSVSDIYEDMSRLQNKGIATPMPDRMIYAPD